MTNRQEVAMACFKVPPLYLSQVSEPAPTQNSTTFWTRYRISHVSLSP